MCGICGVVIGPGSRRTVDHAVIERMRDVIIHRGPDGCGSFVAPGVGLGHRRLSIVDVAHGAQPFASPDGRFQLIYNGEVYNHPSLMEQLRGEGVAYRTHCDTETLLHLYERHGTETPRHLRGMFAFAVWDQQKRSLFLARDRFGVKPVYYAHLDDGTLLFASEIKSLLASGMIAATLNEAALPDYLANHAPSGVDTLFEGIKRLPAGHSLDWNAGRLTISRYWELSYGEPLTGRSDAELIDEYRERLREAVRLRLMADVPLGMFLSGGIDSAAITALMSGLIDEPVKTFSVAFAEREANELAYARMVAERFRTDHHEVTVSSGEFFQAVPRLVWHEDEPMAHPSSVALNFVSRLAAERVKVVLTGEGSDETLAGYNRYRVTLYNLAFGRAYTRAVPASLRRLVRRGVEGLPAGVPLGRKLTRTFLTRAPSLAELYFDNFAVFDRPWQARLLTSDVRERVAGVNPYAALEAAFNGADAHTLLDRLLYADTKTYLHELLMKQDQMSMAASIESRVPFLDHPLVEFASRLPQRLKLRGVTTKYVLRKAMRGVLPAEVLSRRKMGFPVPVGRWLRGEHQPVIDHLVLSERALARGLFRPESLRELVAQHLQGERNHSERLWSLINLELWFRLFIDGQDVQDVTMTGAERNVLSLQS